MWLKLAKVFLIRCISLVVETFFLDIDAIEGNSFPGLYPAVGMILEICSGLRAVLVMKAMAHSAIRIIGNVVVSEPAVAEVSLQ